MFNGRYGKVIDRTQQQLEMSFDGEAVRDGRMDVRDLAPSMLGLGALFESANRILNGPRATINVSVKATSTSSFHIVFEVNQLFQSVQQSGSFQDMISTAANVTTLLFTGGVSLIALVRLLHGKSPKIEKMNDNLYKLTIDGQTYEIPLGLFRLYQDTQVRKALADMVQPVKQAGIDEFQIHDEKHRQLQIITKKDVGVFDMPTVQELLSDSTSEKAFSIISLAFTGDYVWRLYDGSETISVVMKDEAFQKQVNNSMEAFAKDDILFCQLRTVQWRVQDKIKTDYEVLKVIKHIQARQLPLLPLPD
jgi:hypothetical protein